MPIRTKRSRRQQIDDSVRFINIAKCGFMTSTPVASAICSRVRESSLAGMYWRGQLSKADRAALDEAVERGVLDPKWLRDIPEQGKITDG